MVSIAVKPEVLEPGPIRVVAIDTGSGLVHLNPEGGGVVVGMVLSTLEGSNVTVKDDESLHIYQSTRRFQITGSGFKDSTKARMGRWISTCLTLCRRRRRSVPRPKVITTDTPSGYLPSPGSSVRILVDNMVAATHVHS